MKWYKVWTSDLSAPIMLIRAESQPQALKKAREENRSYDQIEEYKAANKCDCYRKRTVRESRWTITGHQYTVEKVVGYCIGTKEQEICRCKGIKEKCDFYPDYRK